MPTDGEVWIADLGEEIRRRVLVLSDARLHQIANRAVVAPMSTKVPDSAPWFVDAGDDEYANVHLIRSIPVARLLERARVIDHRAMVEIRSVLTHLLDL
ncbi:MAG: type II toxin-antitoxin system PemK/MazF family toxin [Actinomycetota bacterium]|jgi:mRNA-degrading endonuclease toxin of MazEF toxin-antitoxin module|nr:type II toxin-antitoxin system PemK/MazF family toxin [Actinomycetota bacterium]MDA2974007.1 type II toxin-antitoxin system PemK/MazF family toxin [Actinomycetota bacterium]